MQQLISKTISATAIGIAFLSGGVALATPTPAQTCQASKSKAAGKFAACRQTAEAKLATTGDVPKYTAALTKCGTVFTTAWQKAIDKATLAGASCPDAPLTASDFQTIITAHSLQVAGGLSGVGLQVCSAATRLKTGQTTCYDTAGAGLPCAGTGHDGELQKGIARSYTDHGDGTITDNITGLMWEKLSFDGSIHDKDALYTWANAFTGKVAALNTASFAGYNDWRLPNANELQSLVNFGLSPSIDAPFNTGCAAACTVTTCSCTRPASYWSSTSHHASPFLAWDVSFVGGVFGGNTVVLGGNNKGLTDHVRAVRDSCAAAARPLKTGQTTCYDTLGATLASCENTGQDGELQKGVARSYTDNGNGTITDNNTGLIWEKLSNDASIHDKDNLYPWATAFTTKIAALNSSVFGGRSDWRLPNANELQSLANYGAANPAVNAIFNTSCPGGCLPTACSCTNNGFYWSSTTNESATAGAWGGFFSIGDLHQGSKAVGDFARAVAGGS